MTATRFHILPGVLLALAAMLVSCDSVEPEESGGLVVQAFMEVGHRPSSIRLRTTVPLDASSGVAERAAASDASVNLRINGERLRYSEATPGQYEPPDDYERPLEPGDRFDLQVDWQGMAAAASGTIPPRILLDSITVSAPSRPVEAILVDSLRFDTLGVDATKSYIFPIETTLWWSEMESADPDSWIQAQLSPRREFNSVVVDFFLLPEEVFRESDAGTSGVRSWTGLYAVPADSKDSPLPSHDLRVAVVRSSESYADFASGRADSGQQEPPSNIEGGLGIAVGLSVDSVTVQVDPAVVGRKSIVVRR